MEKDELIALLEIEAREIIHRRLWIGHGNCTIKPRLVARASSRKLHLKRYPRTIYKRICKILDSINATIIDHTSKAYSRGNAPDRMNNRWSERIYQLSEVIDNGN